VVVSHDRYFVERVADDVYGLDRDGGIRHLPGGVEEYVEMRRAETSPAPDSAAPRAATPGAVVRAARKEVQRLERALDRLNEREAALHEEMAASATDHARLSELTAELSAALAERERLEASWLEASETLEQA
jgi:ATP-binding cassette subfamily F protein uup